MSIHNKKCKVRIDYSAELQFSTSFSCSRREQDLVEYGAEVRDCHIFSSNKKISVLKLIFSLLFTIRMRKSAEGQQKLKIEHRGPMRRNSV